MKLDDGRLTFVAQQEVTALDAIHKAVLGKAACAGRVTEGVGTCISIHAPTWGATRRRTLSTVYIKFQSTHPRGVRHVLQSHSRENKNFNPRTHVGCDEVSPTGIVSSSLISIHAPTWGATKAECSADCGAEFQSTHPRGVRLIEMSMSPVTRLFQSTHPRGVRRTRRC